MRSGRNCFRARPCRGLLFFLVVLQLAYAFSDRNWQTPLFSASSSKRLVLPTRRAPRWKEWLFASTSKRAESSTSSSKRNPDATVDNKDDNDENLNKQRNQNAAYISSLLDNLTHVLDTWIMNGSPQEKERAHNILNMIESTSDSSEYTQQAYRMMKRAGMPLPTSSNIELGHTDNAGRRRDEARARQEWEQQVEDKEKVVDKVGRSALSNRAAKNSKPDVFLSSVDSRLSQPEAFAKDKAALEESLSASSTDKSSDASSSLDTDTRTKLQEAYVKSSELVALAGANFNGETLGIGGLDDVLSQVKRRIWVPLAAPPQLLQELGIHPVRGLLLYGMPGCGKTLLARTLGRMLSPQRPVTVVSGPELMDKFVGSSEKNLRELFDNPPDIYDRHRIGEPDGGEAMARAALHVIILDEFDAMARTRGGRDGKGDQGDAGVARDSVVNQLLAKMDGVDALLVPTLVIGLTNKRSLIESALLRPGRFEVQIEVPPPRTMEQRISILKVHTMQMFEAGRLLVRDASEGTAAFRHVDSHGSEGLLTYDGLLEVLATECDGMSGASLAGVARAAASHALERAVEEFSASAGQGHPVLDCLVTRDDFEGAVKDVFESSGDSDWEGADDASSTPSPEKTPEKGDDVEKDESSGTSS